MKTLEQELAALQWQLALAAHNTLTEAGELGQEAARNTRLFKNNGPLRAATTFRPTGQFTGFIGADKSYATFLENGNPSEGFTIRPTNAKVLHFKIDGKDIFVQSAKAHAGYHFMQNAEENVSREIGSIWAHNIDKVLK